MYRSKKFYKFIAADLVMDLQMNGANKSGYLRQRTLRIPEPH
jgi:hypothetical protein